MFRIPSAGPTPFNSAHVSTLQRIYVQYADATDTTKVSQLDTAFARRKVLHDKSSPLVFKVIPTSPSDYLTLQFDSLVHDTTEEAEVHTLSVDYAFTLIPDSVHTIFGTCTSTRTAFYKNITLFTIPPELFHSQHVTLHFNTVPLHNISQLCIKNDTTKYVTVKLMKTVSIDCYNKAPFTA